jgi:hypothetical protein
MSFNYSCLVAGFAASQSEGFTYVCMAGYPILQALQGRRQTAWCAEVRTRVRWICRAAVPGGGSLGLHPAFRDWQAKKSSLSGASPRSMCDFGHAGGSFGMTGWRLTS